MSEAGLVSTVIPVFNRPAELVASVESVIAQTHRPIEVIIVDDGSSDDTPTVARSLAQKYPGIVRVLRQENSGPGVARETGRRDARGEFLQYLDSDDVLLPDKFRLQVAALSAHPHTDVAYGWVRYRHADGSVHPAPWKRTAQRLPDLFPSILTERWWETACPLYRASLCDRAGPWLPIDHEEDWEYDCRLGAMGARLVQVEGYVCEHRDHAGDRLSTRQPTARNMAHRAIAQAAMYAHADRAGLERGRPEFAEFARRTFLLSRQCGAAGLVEQSRELFEIARKASANGRANGFDFVLYGTVARLIGWGPAGRIACWADRFRGHG